MLALLLDEHISPKVGYRLSQKDSALTVHTLQNWEDGRYLQMSDDVLIERAFQKSLVFVTYDLRTIPKLLADLANQRREHAGIIFIDEKTVPPNNIGLLITSLYGLWKKEKDAVWQNRTVFLQKDT